MSPTLTIDRESAPGSWARAIADTPHLAAQVSETTIGRRPERAGKAGSFTPRSPALPDHSSMPWSVYEAALEAEYGR